MNQNEIEEFNKIMAEEEVKIENIQDIRLALQELKLLLDNKEISEEITLAELKKFISDKLAEFEMIKETANDGANEEDLQELRKLAQEESVRINKDKQNLISLLSALNYISGNENEIRVGNIILQIKKFLEEKEGQV